MGPIGAPDEKLLITNTQPTKLKNEARNPFIHLVKLKELSSERNATIPMIWKTKESTPQNAMVQYTASRFKILSQYLIAKI